MAVVTQKNYLDLEGLKIYDEKIKKFIDLEARNSLYKDGEVVSHILSTSDSDEVTVSVEDYNAIIGGETKIIDNKDVAYDSENGYFTISGNQVVSDIEVKEKITIAQGIQNAEDAATEASAVTIDPDAEVTTGYLKTYNFTQNGELIGKIDIPKDFLVKSAKLVKYVFNAEDNCYYDEIGDKEHTTPITVLPEEVDAGVEYIDFTVNVKAGEETGDESHIYIDITTLANTYTVEEDAEEVQLAISNDYVISAEIVEKSIAEEKLTKEVQDILDTADAIDAIEISEIEKLFD